MEPTDSAADVAAAQTERMVADSGSYELLKGRLTALGQALQAGTRRLNEARLTEFGQSDQTLLLRTRARTENNCISRDIVRIGDLLLFGFNVYIGLRKETTVGDVFALYRFNPDGAGDELEPEPLAGSFLEDGRFVADFRELVAYYKQATLQQLRVTHDKLLASFRIGQQVHDVRVFRWQIRADGQVQYTDNRGERDMALPATHDFEWTAATRDDQVGGRFPHVNVLDTVFVETIGGDLTLKIENNTDSGLGIFSEPVEDKNQSLADAEIAHARLGPLVLLRVRPYREQTVRYLVYNSRTQKAERIDAIGESCVQLPEDHGIVFPGGIYLQSGETKRFELPAEVATGLRFKRMQRAPNGEDVLYVFYHPVSGHYALFTYNLIDKSLAPPIMANGYARFPDGRMLVFQVEGGEPTRVHPMQLWRTAFASDEHAQANPVGQGFFGRIGNAELVRGISELMGIARAVTEQVPTRAAYEDLIRQCSRVADAFFWLDQPEAGDVLEKVTAIGEVSSATLVEFEKVDSLRRDTERRLRLAEGEQRALLTDIASSLWRRADEFVTALARLRDQRGQLQLMRELRYVDLGRLDRLDTELAAEQQRTGERAMQFLAGERAFDSQRQALDRLSLDLEAARTSTALAQVLAALDTQAAGLDLLIEQLGGLPGGDAVQRTAILDRIGSLYADINRLRADARRQRGSLGAAEAKAEFGAQFKLFNQAVGNAVDFADSPEKCDEALTRLLAQLEELEGRFAEHETFVADIAAQRETVYEALSSRRQALVEARQRRVQAIGDAARRILGGVPRRVDQLAELAQVHAYFASDPLIGKLRSLVQDLRNLGAGVPADELETQLKTARDQALRSVRDQRELSAPDGQTLRLGRHAFTVNRQPLDITLVPRSGQMQFHITGSDYFQPVADERLSALAAFWDQPLVSETAELSRAEYLAGQLLTQVLQGRSRVTWRELLAAATADDAQASLLGYVRDFAATRYHEGYQKGVHDDDAARLLARLVPMQDAAGLLAYEPTARALALLYWQHVGDDAQRDSSARRARSSLTLSKLFGAHDALRQFEAELTQAIVAFGPTVVPDLLEPMSSGSGVPASPAGWPTLAARAAAYLVRELGQRHDSLDWVASGAGLDLAQALTRELEQRHQLADWQRDLSAAGPAERWRMARHWVRAIANLDADPAAPGGGTPGALRAWCDDAASVLALDLPRRRLDVTLDGVVEGLRGEHTRVIDGRLAVNLNDFWSRLAHHIQQVVPAFEQLHALRLELLQTERTRLQLAQFQARPLSSFVRNRLVDEVYLPLVGDNLAKQIGAAGDVSRSDRMGLLLLISPPGYGKTTLLEYVADRLGMTFVRINCPALGHDITSIDPDAARHGAARQELEKLNLGLIMGNNVMLYLDDIQHTHPEFLQKFIALADGTRRVEAMWNGESRAVDLRGKRFALVMAGNPYTESGEVFKIPDMLANRADIYNLGDVLSGREDLFALSYIENCLTANPVLLPLASREPTDVQRLVRLAEGNEIATTEFSHPYSGAEIDELTALLRRLFRARDLLLKVNLAYIESAAQQDNYRTQPPFKLQGSYRNMAKLAARITPLMDEAELDALLRDHYRGEAQTLTTGAEENLLRLAHLLGHPSEAEAARWSSICGEYLRQRRLGGDDADGSTRIAASVLDVAQAVQDLRASASQEATASEAQRLAEAVLEIAITYRKILMPLISATERRLNLDQAVHDQVAQVSRQLDERVGRKTKKPEG
jgi:MoxR-like ATPase